MKKDYIQPTIRVRVLEHLMVIRTSQTYEEVEGYSKRHNIVYDDEFDETDPTEICPDNIFSGDPLEK